MGIDDARDGVQNKEMDHIDKHSDRNHERESVERERKVSARPSAFASLAQLQPSRDIEFLGHVLPACSHVVTLGLRRGRSAFVSGRAQMAAVK